MVTTKKSGGKAFATMLWLGLVLLFAACQPPGPKALLDGERLIQEGEYERALKRLNKAAELLPANAQVWNHIGLAQHGLGNYQEAIKAYSQALKLDRDLAAVHFNLGSLFLDMNRLPDAINRLRVFVTVQPDHAEGWVKLGTTLLRSGNPDQAETAFMRALQKTPRDPEIHNNLGLVHVQRKRPRDAMRCFRNALQLNPNYAPAMLNQAIVEHYHLGDKRAALASYQRYLQTKPSPGNAQRVQAIVANLQAELNPPPIQVAAATPPPVQEKPAAPTNQPPVTAPATNQPAPPTAPATNQTAVGSRTNAPAERKDQGLAPEIRLAQTDSGVTTPQTEAPAGPGPEASKPEPAPKTSAQTNQAATSPASPEKTSPAQDEPEASPEPEPEAEPESQPEPEPKSEPEPEPEPVPVEVVELQQDPLFKPAPPPVDTNDSQTPAQAESSQMAAANTTPAEPPPLLIPRRSHSEADEESGLLSRVNPMRFFRRDREEQPAPELTPEPIRPVRRPVPEEPAPPPVREARPLPPNIPRYDYRSDLQLKPGNPAEAERFFAQGARAQQQKRFLAAIELYQRALAADPTHFEANYNLALAAYQAGNLPQALAAGEQAVQVNPQSTNARFNFALALREANYPLDAVEQLQKLLVESPNEVRAHFSLANIYAQELDQPLLAEEHYQRVLQLQPSHPEAARIRLWLAHPE